ncbi:hypothetical protein D5F01_LYC18946 [Larimichthys crocea]|uniref:Uncharacterized protein n=1 Tax=Larimichthys crocea TaxID=215358 RepID=A0A6G0HWU8_LARCR|nr:hypothetical protein D5F01_LYC18946 [Larimichthys crocea]
MIEGFPAIAKCQLEDADRQDMVDRMVQTYGLHGALQITAEILKKINRNDLVSFFPKVSLNPTRLPLMMERLRTTQEVLAFNSRFFLNLPPQMLRLKLAAYGNHIKPQTASAEEVCMKAVDKALQSPNGHLDLFLRFLLGLSLKSNQDLLQGLLKQTGSSTETNHKLVEYIKMKIGENPSPERCINLFNCLSEMKDCSLVEEIQHYLTTRSLSTVNLSPTQWSALVMCYCHLNKTWMCLT